jgi:ribonuclease HII
MLPWDIKSNKIKKISINRERSKAILNSVLLREKFLKNNDEREFASIFIETDYEMIKELITALMYLDGYKTLSHEYLISFLSKFYKDFSEYEINLIDKLRITRNKIAYEGYLRRYLNNKEMGLIVEHKAERFFPVGAASILAKVTRDEEIKKLEAKYGIIGPGYQSNETTQKFIQENFDKHPEIFRKSWATWKNQDKKTKQSTLDEF